MLNAATLDASAMKLPPSQAKDPSGRISDRLFLLEEGLSHLERRFAAFLEQRAGDAEGLCEALKAWIARGLQGETGEVPWEG